MDLGAERERRPDPPPPLARMGVKRGKRNSELAQPPAAVVRAPPPLQACAMGSPSWQASKAEMTPQLATSTSTSTSAPRLDLELDLDPWRSAPPSPNPFVVELVHKPPAAGGTERTAIRRPRSQPPSPPRDLIVPFVRCQGDRGCCCCCCGCCFLAPASRLVAWRLWLLGMAPVAAAASAAAPLGSTRSPRS